MLRRTPRPLPTIWRVPHDLWRVVERALEQLDPPRRTGRKRIDPRGAAVAVERPEPSPTTPSTCAWTKATTTKPAGA